MPFAKTLLASLATDLPCLYGPLFLIVLATLMLWPLDSWLLKSMPKHKWRGVALFGLIAALYLCGMQSNHTGFNGMFTVDGMTRGYQGLCLLAGMVTVALSQPQLSALKEHTVEYYALILFSVAGMLLLAGATDLVSIYFSLELMALCIYILVAYLRDQVRSVEAGMKYFLLGAFSSGILLYGISLIFAVSGGVGTQLIQLKTQLAMAQGQNNLVLVAGVVMVLAGFAFKVAAAPFHMWSPDVYEGAPTPITAFMSIAPKAAALAAFLRIFGIGFHGISDAWTLPLSFVAGVSMIWGNVAALKQDSVKRMLAYSSIAHVGYMLLGILSVDVQAGAQAIWLYMFTYLLMQSGAFAVIIHLQGKGEGESLDNFKGLAKRNPVLAFAMMIFMLSLAGIPPLIGFFSKFYLFRLAIAQGHVTLTVIALLTSAIAAFYYLNVVATMYFKEPAQDVAPLPSGGFTFVLTCSCLLVLLGTFFGNKLMAWTASVLVGAAL